MADFKCPLDPPPLWCEKQCEKVDKNDPQSIRLYCLEESLVSFRREETPLPLNECRLLAEEICKEYKSPIPEIKDGRGLKVAKCSFDGKKKLVIKLPRHLRYRIAVLHEATHCVVQYHYRDKESGYQQHGPTYIRYLLDVYARYLDIPIATLERAATLFQLNFKPV
jgi:hypothetical protein